MANPGGGHRTIDQLFYSVLMAAENELQRTLTQGEHRTLLNAYNYVRRGPEAWDMGPIQIYYAVRQVWINLMHRTTMQR